MTSTLDEKILQTEKILVDLLKEADPARVRVAWTGGKDSTVVLFFWRAILAEAGKLPVHSINLDTGCKFPEVLALRDRLTREWNIDLHIARPGVDLENYPLAVDPLQCCRDLKILPLKRAIVETRATHLLSGIRRDESPDRAGRQFLEQRDDPPHVMVNPILEWTETDIWAFHARFDIPSCELYNQGYRSLGCRPCTRKNSPGSDERAGRSKAKEAVLGTLTGLGYF